MLTRQGLLAVLAISHLGCAKVGTRREEERPLARGVNMLLLIGATQTALVATRIYQPVCRNQPDQEGQESPAINGHVEHQALYAK